MPARRIAFNACECLQRVCKEHRWVNLRALDLCLLTALRPSHALGLPGVVLALSEIGAAKLTVRGPGGTENFVASVSEFVRRKWPRVEARDVCPTAAGDAPAGSGAGAREACYSTSVFEGDGLRIDARVLWLSSPRAPGVGSGTAKQPALASARPPPPQTIGVTPAPPPLVSVVRPAKRARSSQPTLAQYRSGGASLVWYKCSLERATLYIVDCPSPDWIERCVSVELDEPRPPSPLTSGDNASQRIVLHLSPEEVLRDPRYVAWTAAHRASQDSAAALALLGGRGLVFGSSAWQQARLHGIDPLHFAAPFVDRAPTESAAIPARRLGVGAHVRLGSRATDPPGAADKCEDGQDGRGGDALLVDESRCDALTPARLWDAVVGGRLRRAEEERVLPSTVMETANARRGGAARRSDPRAGDGSAAEAPSRRGAVPRHGIGGSVQAAREQRGARARARVWGRAAGRW